MRKLTPAQVRSEFAVYWRQRVADVPAYRNDMPAKNMAFSCFVDDLHREGRITYNTAQNVTMLPQLWCVKMTTHDGRGVYLSHRGRMRWSKATAQKHCDDVSKNKMYTPHYIKFEIEAD